MKRLIFVVFTLAVFLSAPMSASAGVKEWLKKRVPGVAINVPDLTKRNREPAARVVADGTGADVSGTLFRNKEAVVGDKAEAAQIPAESDSDNSTGSFPQAETRSREIRGNNRTDGIVYPNGGKTKKPDLRSAVVGVALSPGSSGVGQKIYGELHKRGIPYVPVGGSCERQDTPVVCFVVSEPRRGPAASFSDHRSSNTSGRNRRSSTSSYSSGNFDYYHVVVEAWLYPNDGSAPQYLGGVVREFTYARNSHSSWRNSTSRGGRHNSSSGNSSRRGDYFAQEAAGAARKAIEHLLNKDGAWLPEASLLVEEAFR